jgi:hypothetical protein
MGWPIYLQQQTYLMSVATAVEWPLGNMAGYCPQLIESARRDCKLKESPVGVQSGRPQPSSVILNDRPAD